MRCVALARQTARCKVHAQVAESIEELGMSTVVIELATEHLKMGLYVCGLDRPWEETPFLFQGFILDSDEDLQMLRRLCKVVYVEVSDQLAEELKSVVRRKPGAAVRPQEAPDPFEALSIDITATMDRVPIKDSTPLETELT